MPGAALWLVAPGTPPSPTLPTTTSPTATAPSAAAATPLPTRLQTLITTTLPSTYPSLCHPSPFIPHLTLTSGIDPARYGAAPQAWLDALPLENITTMALPRVRFGQLQTADTFVRRCTVAVDKAGVAALGRAARGAVVAVEESEDEAGRVERVEEWLEAWEPHVSLIYGSKPIDGAMLGQIAQTVWEVGVRLGDDVGKKGEGEDADAGPENGGWEGGEVWLVPTYEEIGKWRPIASRVL